MTVPGAPLDSLGIPVDLRNYLETPPINHFVLSAQPAEIKNLDTNRNLESRAFLQKNFTNVDAPNKFGQENEADDGPRLQLDHECIHLDPTLPKYEDVKEKLVDSQQFVQYDDYIVYTCSSDTSEEATEQRDHKDQLLDGLPIASTESETRKRDKIPLIIVHLVP